MKQDQLILIAAVGLAVVLVAKKSGVLDKLTTVRQAPLPSLDTGRGFDAADPGRYMSVADLIDASTGTSYDDIPTFNQTIDSVIGNYDREHAFGPRVWTPF